MKILFITPHLSTGGAPQYLLKKIKELVDEHDVYCVEYSNVTGGVLVVQRNQVEEILKNKLITLDENKLELITHIENIQPDIVHFEELPEYFCDNNVSNKIYVSHRKYKIIETSHDSSFDVNNKRYFPDRFIFVSEYQKQLFSPLNIPMDVVEYPIESKTKTDRENSLLELGLDPNKTHFLNVGLFTSRKNQAEIIEYARQMVDEPVQFHFVGNQADNFKWYWEPLMANFPPNCKWWGERKDVDTFYNAMDVFLFTSKGTVKDKETNPLVVREAIGWGIPILMYNLPVYCGMYNKYKNIQWLSEDLNENINLIKKACMKNSNSSESIKDALFNIKFDFDTNKFDIEYKGSECLNDVLFSIKDRDSRSCIYSCVWDRIVLDSHLWIIPLPKHVYDFKNKKTFGGFLIQIFDSSENIIFEKEIFIKNVNVEKPIFDFSNSEPIFLNYNEFFIDKIYEEFLGNNNELNVVIDVGANVGMFSKYIRIKGAKKLICYEPNVKAYNQLKENLKDECDIKIYNLAISYTNGKIKLYTDDNNTLISTGCNKTDTFYEVECATINDIFAKNNIDFIDLLKVDIEGMEFELFEHCDRLTFDKIKTVLIEYHDFHFEDGLQKVSQLRNILEKNGFKTTMPTQHKFIYGYK
jgi:FkbM family methyltransferase